MSTRNSFRSFVLPRPATTLARALTAAVFAAYATSATYAATLNVPAQYGTIQAALTASQDGDVVRVADGTYSGFGNVDLDTLGRNVTLISVNGPSKTIIDCQGTALDNHFGITCHANEPATTTISGFTIENGYVGGTGQGAGIHVDGASPTITNCIFLNNSVVGNGTQGSGGGGVFLSHSKSVVTNCSFTGNVSNGGYGGGLLSDDINSNLFTIDSRVSNCTFTGNSAASGGGLYGFFSEGLDNCTFTNNTAGEGGGAVLTEYANLVTRCTFTSNSASAFGGGASTETTTYFTSCVFNGNAAANQGGAIYAGPNMRVISDNCTFSNNSAGTGGAIYIGSTTYLNTITNCAFTGNSALSYGGGAYYANNAFTTITRCAFIGNMSVTAGAVVVGGHTCQITKCAFTDNGASDPSSHGGAVLIGPCTTATLDADTFNGNGAYEGGGLYTTTYNFAVTNCAFFQNTASYGAGTYSYQPQYAGYGTGPQTLFNCTYTANTATLGGSAIYTESNPIGITNCIAYADTTDEIGVTGPAPTVRYCDVLGGYTGTGNINVNPLFVNAALNNYHLQGTSPCLAHGVFAGAPTTDAEGNTRPAPPSIGAYEVTRPSLTASGLGGVMHLTWTATPGATSYKVYRSATSGAELSLTPIATGITTLQYTDLSALVHQTYFYTVTASTPQNGLFISNEARALVIPAPVSFSGNGTTDLLLEDSATNQLTIWTMNGYTQASVRTVATAPAAVWKVVGTADFNHDGKTDILFQNSTTHQLVVYFMNGGAVLSRVGIAIAPAANQKVVGTGDFDADGNTDLIIQNTTTNQVTIWFMNGTTRVSASVVPTTLPAGWNVVGSGDFNQDGISDLVFQDSKTNRIALWYMSGYTRTGAILLPTPSAQLKVTAIGDFNNDGHPDLVLQNATTRQIVLWFLGGTTGATVLSQRTVATLPAANMAVVGPR